MKAIAVRPDRKEVALVDHEAPKPPLADEVEVRILDVGICGTDREICTFEYGRVPVGEPHLVIGHEALGEVVRVGEAVTSVAEGDLVIPMVRRPCPHAHCAACRAGRQDFCFTGDFAERGISGLHGFMTERIVDQERYFHVVPAALREVAILVEPLTIAEKALLQVDDIQERLPWACTIESGTPRRACRRAVVLGAGPVGLLGAMALVQRGFETTVYSREPAPNPKSDLTAAIGARYVNAGETTVEELMGQTGPIDLVYEATGASAVAFRMLQALGTNGIFVFTGVPGRRGPIEVDTDSLMRNLVLRNQVLFGTVNAGHDAFAAAIEDLGGFLARWPEAVRSLITTRRGVDDWRDLLLGPASGIKNVLSFA